MFESQNERECYISEIAGEWLKGTIRLTVCRDLPVEYEYKENLFCILHFPDNEKHKTTNFREVFQLKLDLQQNNFSYVYFPDSVNLTAHKFTNNAYFNGAVFTQEASFYLTIFEQKANFTNAVFINDAHFGEAVFQNAFFGKAFFNERADFSKAFFTQECDFGGTVFTKYANFSKANFNDEAQIFFTETEFKQMAFFDYAIFKGYVSFAGNGTKNVFFGNDVWLDLQYARLEKPERIGFHTVRLRPSWFVNVDSRKFVFTDINWENADGTRDAAQSELNALREYSIIERPHRLLTIACRQLAANAEENNRYEEASNFRRMAMECEWLDKSNKYKTWFRWTLLRPCLKRKIGGLWIKPSFWLLRLKRKVFGFAAKILSPVWRFFHWLPQYDFLLLAYRRLSNYGEGWRLAFGILLGILIISAILYKQFDFYICLPNEACQIGKLTWFEAIKHSLGTAILQNSEIRKPIGYAEIVVNLEKIFAPLQAALLALAIRRKFMR